MRLRSALVFVSIACAVVFFGRAAAEYAPSDLTLEQLVQKADAALGHFNGNAYVESERVVHPDGIETVMTQRAGADWLSIDTRGPITTLEGYSKGQYWWQDPNGTVLLESGFHGGDSEGSILHPSAGTHLTLLGTTQTEPREYVVEEQRADGLTLDAYYDARTFLLARVETRGVSGAGVTTFADYRDVDGEMVAFHRHFSDGTSADDEQVDVVSYSANEGTVPGMPSSRSIFTLGDAPVMLPVRLDNEGELITHVTIGGHGADFVLDSGASILTIDARLAQRFGMQRVGYRAVASEVKFGSLAAHNLVFDVFTPASELGEYPVAGLMGCDVFASAIVGIDLKQGTVTLYPRSTFNPAALGVTPMAIDVDDCLARAPASFNGVAGNFLIDTGAFAATLFHHYLAKVPGALQTENGLAMGNDAYLDPSVGTVLGVSGNVAVRTYTVPNVVFGPARFRLGQVVVPNDPSIGGLEDYDGIIGCNILMHYIVYLDYADRLAFLKPNG